MTCQIRRPRPDVANWAIGARGKRGDDHNQWFGGSKTVGQTNKQSETFGNTVGPEEQMTESRGIREIPQ